ncbi:DUF3060 domain-containing protein [Arthrobacter cheniae]|uniref:DUF3060 domain-containing protein n=1 Tax=Arthrobacter cheniae TaxID=1258888 RepID=A0A3A5M680_9MICC|nr:DUF3060 domain-containing protein [Arthrobacter cheniae]RJT75106.1 DUF3060 domain-containing protein [Arthrobacter cheniae]
MRNTYRPAATILSAATLLALISGCTDNATPPPVNAPTGTVSADAPAPVTPEGTSTASTASDSSSTPPAGETATGKPIRLSQEDEHDITSANTTVTIVCEGGGDIDLDADGTTVDITGECEDIDIDGNDNTVTGETVGSLSIDGTNNTATMASAPDIDVDGSTNAVTVEDTRDIDVDGDSNTVTYASGDPSIENEGNNSISAR